MLFGWVPLTIILFLRLAPHRAVLVSVIGGWLLLPIAGFDMPGIPEYDKGTAIAMGLILGGWLSGAQRAAAFRWKVYDVPMILWCLCPLASSVTNHLGWYDGFSGVFGQIMIWGVPYLAGRIYFTTPETIKDLCLGIVIGGLVYVPLCLYEFRMSPRLSINLYGFFPHEWRQHSRYGFWRPIVFMQHGLMVALWMATSATAAFWLWRSRVVNQIMGIPMPLIVISLAIMTMLCLSANGWFALGLGCSAYFIGQRFDSNLPFLMLLLTIPLYTILRISGALTGHDIETAAGYLFSAERVYSLGIRLLQEDLFVRKAMDNLLFGAGRASLAWPVDPVTGRELVKMIDPLWLIVFSFRGGFGLVTFLFSMLGGPWLIFRSARGKMEEINEPNLLIVLLGLIVTLFMIDSIMNAMINPVYTISTGAIFSIFAKPNRDAILKTVIARNKLRKIVYLRQKFNII
jgi:hypothetical protein